MDKQDALKVIGRLQALWTRWIANLEQEAIWIKCLLPCPLAAAMASVERLYKLKSGRIEPPLPDYLDILKDWKTDHNEQPKSYPWQDIWFLCTNLTQGKRQKQGKIGMLIRLEYPANKIFGPQEADNACKYLYSIYAGVWTFVGHDQEDAWDRRRELTKREKEPTEDESLKELLPISQENTNNPESFNPNSIMKQDGIPF